MKDPVVKLLVFWLLAVVLLIGCALVFSSCEIIKGKKSVQSDSTAVKKEQVVKVDSTTSGSVTKSDVSEMYEKWKETVSYPVDTTINNYYTQPVQVIREYEKGEKQETKTDSSFYKNFQSMMFLAIDSLNRKIDSYEKSKQSETKGLGLFMVVLIALGVVVFFKGLGFITSKYKIVKN